MPPPQRIDWAAEVKTFRRRQRISQAELAGILGISTRGVQYIEAAKCRPRVSTRGKFLQLKAKHEKEQDARRTHTATVGS